MSEVQELPVEGQVTISLRELAAKIERRFTPHAVNCDDVGCGPSKLNGSDWARYYQMEDIVRWLREGCPE